MASKYTNDLPDGVCFWRCDCKLQISRVCFSPRPGEVPQMLIQLITPDGEAWGYSFHDQAVAADFIMNLTDLMHKVWPDQPLEQRT
jgi:hypothetical protein